MSRHRRRDPTGPFGGRKSMHPLQIREHVQHIRGHVQHAASSSAHNTHAPAAMHCVLLCSTMPCIT